VAALVETPEGRSGQRQRAFTLTQAVAVIDASRERPEVQLHSGLQDHRRPAALMHAYIVLSLMTGVRTEEARAIRWDHVHLDGVPGADPPVPPHVNAWRADRVGGDTKTPKLRRGLGLPKLVIMALRDLRVSQADERWHHGTGGRTPGLCSTTATGTPLDAKNIRRMCKDVCERAEVGTDWAPNDGRRSEYLRDLQADQADAGRGAGDEHGLPGLEAGAGEGSVLGEQPGGQSGGFVVSQILGDGHDVPMVGQDVLGEGTLGGTHDTVADAAFSSPGPVAAISSANS